MRPTPETLSDALVAIADSRPMAPFLYRPDGSSIDYRALAGAIANAEEALARRGVRRGDIVAGFVDGRAAMALACAALPVSSTFAPLSPSLPVSAYRELLSRLGARVALVPGDAGHPLAIAAAEAGVPRIGWREPGLRDGTGGGFAFADESAPIPPGRPTRPGHAYVHVTSGTTGRAKLVPLGHAQMLDYARAMIDWLRLVPDDIGAALAPFHFAGGLRATILLPALAGASVVCFAESDVDAFLRTLPALRPTHLSAPFAIHLAILERAGVFAGEIAQSRLRFLRATAGHLAPERIDALERLFRAPVLVGLGSSEVCGVAHDPMPPALRKRGGVGVATLNEIRVRDARGADLPAGETGEIVVRGPLVFDGYLDDPELDARSFDRGWFRTGDLGRLDRDGYLTITGRETEIVNRGGEKISLVEIDRAIAGLAGVREGAAFRMAHATLGEDVAVAIVREPDASIDEIDLIAHLRSRLGPKTAPRVVRFVDRLPRSDAGKVLRESLSQRLSDAPAGTTSPNGPGPELTPIEAALAGLWTQALRVRSVDRDDRYAALGGDADTADRLARAIESVFGVRLRLDTVEDRERSLAEMARAIAVLRR